MGAGESSHVIPEYAHFAEVGQQGRDIGGGVWRNGRYAEQLITTPTVDLPIPVSTMFDTFKCGHAINPNGNAVGLRVNGEGPFVWMTFAEVVDKVGKFGAGFKALGLRRGEKVGFYSKNRLEWQVCEHACYRHGAITVALYDTLGPNAVEYIVNHSESAFVVVSGQCLPKLLEILPQCPALRTVIVFDAASITDEVRAKCEEHGKRVHSYDEVLQLGTDEPCAEEPPEPADTAIIMYTSGTTGTPKGVEITHLNMMATVAGIQLNLRSFTPNERLLSFLPLAHIFERVAEAGILAMGGAVGYFSGDVRNLISDIEALKPTIFIGVPRIFERLHEKIWSVVHGASFLRRKLFTMGYEKKLRLLKEGVVDSTPIYDKIVFSKTKSRLGGEVHTIISGGGPLRPDIQDFLRIVFCCPVVQGYGLTETCAGATVQLATDLSSGILGGPIPCCEIKFLDASDFGPYRLPEYGELCIRGPNVSKGYYKEPEKTAEVFLSDGWFRTGDIARVFPNGTFAIVDRAKSIMKNSLGEYIAPEKLEGVFSGGCPLIGQIMIHGDGHKSKIIAIVVPSEDNIGAWAKAHNIEPVPGKNLVQTVAMPEHAERLSGDIMAQIREVAQGEKLHSFEIPAAVILDGEAWTVENDALTPTMKIKRAILARRYAEQIAAVYAKIEP